jgi:hypothetical protein
MQHIRLKAEEATEAELFMEYGEDPDRMISDLQREAMISIKVAEYMIEMKSVQGQLSGEGQGEDPVVALKAQELQQRAAKDQADIQAKQEGLKIEQQRIAANQQANEARIQGQKKLLISAQPLPWSESMRPNKEVANAFEKRF